LSERALEWQRLTERCRAHPGAVHMTPLSDREIYDKFTRIHLAQARRFVWIATANIKSTGLQFQRRFISFVDLMAVLVNRGVSFRVIHAELPSAPFRARYEQLDAKGQLSAGVEFLHCIRMHAKVFIVDGDVALVGSPNLTGAGIGAKGEFNRNFELAFLLEGREETEPFMNYFDNLWMGSHCPKCGRRDLCPAPAS
jgi:phosphatidylserine/phosphatidylglycerophosphate/cardiolipin synthase-like enzyme